MFHLMMVLKIRGSQFTDRFTTDILTWHHTKCTGTINVVNVGQVSHDDTELACNMQLRKQLYQSDNIPFR